MATDYTLYYWPIPFRGHFPRYVLAQAGATWDEPDFDAVAALKALPVAKQPVPFMGPPVLHDHATDTWLTQMPAVMLYLGRKHGMIGDEVLAIRLLADAVDILLEITCHHGMQMWTAAEWRAFTADRLPLWMQMHERLVPEWDNGTAPVLEHLVLAALWHTMVDRLPDLRPLLHRHAPGLEIQVDRVAAQPRIAAMLAGWADRSPRYCGGQIETSILTMLKETGIS